MENVSNPVLDHIYCNELNLSIKSFSDNSISISKIGTQEEYSCQLKYPAQLLCTNPKISPLQLLCWTLDSKLILLSFDKGYDCTPLILFEETVDEEVCSIVFTKSHKHSIFVLGSKNKLLLLSSKNQKSWSLTHVSTVHSSIVGVAKLDDLTLLVGGSEGTISKWSFVETEFMPKMTAKLFIEEGLKKLQISEKIFNSQNLALLFDNKLIYCDILEDELKEIDTIELEKAEDIAINATGDQILVYADDKYSLYRRVADSLQLVSSE